MAKNVKPKKAERQRLVVVENLRDGCSRTEACRAADLPRRTFYDWLDADDAFRRAVQEAEQEAIELIEGVAFKAAKQAETNPKYQTSMIFFLKARAGWTETQRIEHGGEINIEDARERLAERLKALDAGVSAASAEGGSGGAGGEPDSD